MSNEKGRNPKFRNKDWCMTSFYISEPFKKVWRALDKISHIDKNPGFIQYCKIIEKIDLDKKGQGIRGLYIRWVLTEHFKNYLSKNQQVK